MHLKFSQSMRIINPKFAVVYMLEFYDKGQLFHLTGILKDFLILLGR